MHMGIDKQESFLSRNVTEGLRPFLPLSVWNDPHSRHPLNTLFSHVDSVSYQLPLSKEVIFHPLTSWALLVNGSH